MRARLRITAPRIHSIYVLFHFCLSILPCTWEWDGSFMLTACRRSAGIPSTINEYVPGTIYDCIQVHLYTRLADIKKTLNIWPDVISYIFQPWMAKPVPWIQHTPYSPGSTTALGLAIRPPNYSTLTRPARPTLAWEIHFRLLFFLFFSFSQGAGSRFYKTILSRLSQLEKAVLSPLSIAGVQTRQG